MKISYPHMGYLSIPVYNMLKNLGVEVIAAPPITKKTVELGSLYSPEGVCLPYKINMGNFLESMERGADTLVTVCGAGKCRLGFYNAVQRIQLTEKKDIQFYTINTNNLLHDLYCFLRTVSPHASYLSVSKNILMAVKMLKALDVVNSAKNYYGAHSKTPQQIIDICISGSEQLANCCSFRDINHNRETIVDLMRTASDYPDNMKPVKVALIGEFYVLLEPYVNNRIEDALIKQGIEVEKFINTGDWVFSNTLLKAVGLYNEEKEYLDKAQPYLNYHVGGDGLKSVGSALWCALNGYDGIVHIYPFGCMPEVVAQYALKNIANDYSIPMLTLSIDEHSSDVGIITRIEAFADCIKRKKILQ